MIRKAETMPKERQQIFDGCSLLQANKAPPCSYSDSFWSQNAVSPPLHMRHQTAKIPSSNLHLLLQAPAIGLVVRGGGGAVEFEGAKSRSGGAVLLSAQAAATELLLLVEVISDERPRNKSILEEQLEVDGFTFSPTALLNEGGEGCAASAKRGGRHLHRQRHRRGDRSRCANRLPTPRISLHRFTGADEDI